MASNRVLAGWYLSWLICIVALVIVVLGAKLPQISSVTCNTPNGSCPITINQQLDSIIGQSILTNNADQVSNRLPAGWELTQLDRDLTGNVKIILSEQPAVYTLANKDQRIAITATGQTSPTTATPIFEVPEELFAATVITQHLDTQLHQALLRVSQLNLSENFELSYPNNSEIRLSWSQYTALLDLEQLEHLEWLGVMVIEVSTNQNRYTSPTELDLRFEYPIVRSFSSPQAE